MFKYKEKNGIYLQYSEYSPLQKFSMKQNVHVSYPVSNSQHKLGAILLLLVFHLNH